MFATTLGTRSEFQLGDVNETLDRPVAREIPASRRMAVSMEKAPSIEPACQVLRRGVHSADNRGGGTITR